MLHQIKDSRKVIALDGIELSIVCTVLFTNIATEYLIHLLVIIRNDSFLIYIELRIILKLYNLPL